MDGTTGTYNDLSFNWSFPDGTFSNKTLPAFSFTEPGERIVTLVVTDENGEETELGLLNQVLEPAEGNTWTEMASIRGVTREAMVKAGAAGLFDATRADYLFKEFDAEG